MKKVLLIVLAIIGGSVEAYSQVSIFIPDTTVAVGDTLLLPVKAELNQETEVYGIRTEFSYNTDHLEFISLEREGSIADSVATAWNDTEGNVVVSLASVSPILDSGVLFYVSFTPKNQDISDFQLLNIRINENTTESSSVSGKINSITSPVMLSVQGDTTEVRTTASLPIKLTGLINREVEEIVFTVDYQNPGFEYLGFRRSPDLNETDFLVEELTISATEIRISVQGSITENIEFGEIEILGTSEGEFPIQIVSSEISPSEIEVNTQFTGTVFSEDVTAPEIPQNLSFTKTTESDAVIIELSWEEVTAVDFSEYAITRTEEGGEQTTTKNFIATSASLTDSLFNANSYTYTVQAKDSSGNTSEKSQPVEVMGELVSNEQRSGIPTSYSLKQNYPNPFNPVTQIQFEVPSASKVSVDVFNMVGQKLATLINQQYPAGTHTIQFDAAGMPSGIYIYRFTANGFSQIRKMSLIK